MTTMNWLTLFGVPTLVGLIVGAIFKKFQVDLEKQKVETEAVRDGIQALLRAELISLYNHYYVNKGYCHIYSKENFEHLYQSYIALNGNGVIKDMYVKFMALPTENPNEEEN